MIPCIIQTSFSYIETFVCQLPPHSPTPTWNKTPSELFYLSRSIFSHSALNLLRYHFHFSLKLLCKRSPVSLLILNTCQWFVFLLLHVSLDFYTVDCSLLLLSITMLLIFQNLQVSPSAFSTSLQILPLVYSVLSLHHLLFSINTRSFITPIVKCFKILHLKPTQTVHQTLMYLMCLLLFLVLTSTFIYSTWTNISPIPGPLELFLSQPMKNEFSQVLKQMIN